MKIWQIVLWSLFVIITIVTGFFGAETIPEMLTGKSKIPQLHITYEQTDVCGEECVSYVNITNIDKKKFCFKNNNIITTDKQIKKIKNKIKNNDASFSNFDKKNCIDPKQTITLKIVAYKNNIDNVKWSIPEIGLDPWWYGSDFGWELVDDGNYYHIWNNVDDYYFNVTNGQNRHNNYAQPWSDDDICWKYGNESLCLSDNVFNWSIQNITNEINLTGEHFWNVNNKIIHLRMIDSLHPNDTMIYTHIMANETVDVVWNIDNLRVEGNESHDFIQIDYDTFYMNETFNSTYNNLTYAELYMGDYNTSGSMVLRWNNSETYTLNVSENIFVTRIYQTLTTTFRWIDAKCNWGCNLDQPTGQVDLYVGETYSQQGRISYIGSCPSTGQIGAEFWNGIWQYMSSGTDLKLAGFQFNPAFVFVFGGSGSASWTVTANNEGLYDVRTKCIYNSQTKYSDNQSVNVTIQPVSVGNCSYINLTTDLTLTSNSDNCYNITTNNIDLDCDGYTIIGHEYYKDFVITAQGVTNAKVIDCTINGTNLGIGWYDVNNSNITNFLMMNSTITVTDYPEQYAVYFEDSNNNVVDNVHFEDLYMDVANITNCYSGDSQLARLINSHDNKFSNLYWRNATIIYYADGGEDPGCQADDFYKGQTAKLTNSENNTFLNLNSSGGIQTKSGEGCGFFYCETNNGCSGLNLTNASYTDGNSFDCGISILDSNNVIINDYWGSGDDVGLEIFDGNNIIIDGITFLTGGGTNGAPIGLDGLRDSTISNIYLDHVAGYLYTGGWISDFIINTTFRNIVIKNNPDASCIYDQTNDNNSLWENIYLDNCGDTSNGAAAFNLVDNKYESFIVRNLTINNSNYSGLYSGAIRVFQTINPTVQFFNVTIINMIDGYDIYNFQAVTTNFTDAVFNKSNVGYYTQNSAYTMNFLYNTRFNVTNSTGQPQAATINISNSTGLVQQVYADGTGLTGYVPILSYYQWGDADYNNSYCEDETYLQCFNNYNATAYNDTISEVNSTIFNVSSPRHTFNITLIAQVIEDSCTPLAGLPWIIVDICHFITQTITHSYRAYINEGGRIILENSNLTLPNLTLNGTTNTNYLNCTVDCNINITQ